MSRSARGNPDHGYSKSDSDKRWKIGEHGRARPSVRQMPRATADEAGRRLHQENWGNRAKAPKDGKQYFAVSGMASGVRAKSVF